MDLVVNVLPISANERKRSAAELSLHATESYSVHCVDNKCKE